MAVVGAAVTMTLAPDPPAVTTTTAAPSPRKASPIKVSDSRVPFSLDSLQLYSFPLCVSLPRILR